MSDIEVWRLASLVACASWAFASVFTLRLLNRANGHSPMIRTILLMSAFGIIATLGGAVAAFQADPANLSGWWFSGGMGTRLAQTGMAWTVIALGVRIMRGR